ncbi:MAG: VapC toxin family PIN domain ribonuclease [Agitococcus sp.]|nr:VapC toxin family PIN domain ribonuclease [Agitococcus sp.]
MNVLIDTSVWVDYFKHGNKNLIELMSLDFAMTHPMVLLELACGTPPAPRQQTLQDIGLLRHCQQATLSEVMTFIENEKLYGLGCGLVDMSLLASTLLTPDTQIWTLDKRLLQLATRFRVAYVSYVH